MPNKEALLLAPRLSSLVIHWKSVAKILQAMGYSITFIAKDDYKHKDFIKENNIDFINTDISSSSTNIIQQIKEIKALKNTLKNKKYDVIHAFYLKGAFLAVILSFLYKAKYFLHICGLGSLFNSKRIIFKVYSFFVLYFLSISSWLNNRVFIFETKFLQNTLTNSYWFNAKNTHVTCGVGIDTTLFKPSQTSEKREKNFLRFVLVSRLLKDKGIIEFIEASKILKEKYRQLSFTLIGSEDPFSPMRLTELDMQNLKNSPIKYIPHVHNIHEQLSEYDVFVLPSYHEGLSVSSMEAGACGLVLLLSDIPGCKEIIKEGYNGFTFKKQSSMDIVDSISSLIEGKKDIKEMSKNSREYILGNFSFDILQVQMKRIYSQHVEN
tara:strand:+ start:29198 stop:30337 length:1140 start_codon:yes stop_codon:yes gene_type:complete